MECWVKWSVELNEVEHPYHVDMAANFANTHICWRFLLA